MHRKIHLILSTGQLKLATMKVESKLRFDKYLKELCEKASNKLRA